MLRRRRHRSGEKAKAAIDMTSLIDLTFLLLVTFIVTLPALEQGISIRLPKGKTADLPKEKKTNAVWITKKGVFLNARDESAPLTDAELEAKLKALAAEDPEVPVLVRGDEELDYGEIMRVVNILYRCQIRRMALVTTDR